MSSIQRFSSRRQRLDKEFLAMRLEGAVSYRRIAGYFRSSIFELVGEEICDIPDVRIVCNSELDIADIKVSQAAREAALKARMPVFGPAPEPIRKRTIARCGSVVDGTSNNRSSTAMWRH
ncbi:hypothetical protein [Massilia sp. 9I]|uniref:hypothetical protein n=1 Tax=Massilia sp. 9I TaxID=2653152 RepID=UPI0012EF2892|nr:hypothetical protein [Massilia sp. 9I]VXB31886.1 hypothetical protein MASSI9I_20455 [Massilia sp. 9I]